MTNKVKDFLKKIKERFSFSVKFVENFIEATKEKLKNLYKTNYDLGIYHLEKGNLWDACFRFKIIKRFWPDKLEAQYMYAVTLILENMYEDAYSLLTDILTKDPNYEDARILLEDIQNGVENPIVAKYREMLKIKKENENKNEEKNKDENKENDINTEENQKNEEKNDDEERNDSEEKTEEKTEENEELNNNKDQEDSELEEKDEENKIENENEKNDTILNDEKNQVNEKK